jgi:hypothetical protein
MRLSPAATAYGITLALCSAEVLAHLSFDRELFQPTPHQPVQISTLARSSGPAAAGGSDSEPSTPIGASGAAVAFGHDGHFHLRR